MNNAANKNASLEILVSTKGQDNTDFINRMFKNCSDIKLPVLIVNQSKKKLNFPQNNFRVKSTNEIGLSNSRNLAINNSKEEICLLSDDDVIYSSDFVETIKNSFTENKDADIITYQASNELGDLFKDYPTLKFVIPHGGGAVPVHWGRYRGLAQDMGIPSLEDHLLNNVFFDTCVYHQPGIDCMTKVIPAKNILFASEMIGAVRGIDPETGHNYDDTKRYIDATPNITDEERRMIFEQNIKTVYPRLVT